MKVTFRSPDPDVRPGWRPALDILAAALDAADPEAAVRRHVTVEGSTLRANGEIVDLDSVQHVFLVGAGKAVLGMAHAMEAMLGDVITDGVVVTSRGTGGPSKSESTVTYEAGHPFPDASGLTATRHIARLMDRTTPRDLVIALLSGGASALLEMPAGRIPLADIQSATSALLASGAPIDEVNTVRKHVSAVKGGGLARLAQPARLITLVLSDVVGSPIDVIASGPTVPDRTTFADAAAVLSRYELWSAVPASIADHIRSGLAGHVPETARSGDALFQNVTTLVVGDNASATAAAVGQARASGFDALLLTSYLEGEAREAGKLLASIGKEMVARGRPLTPPACVIAGGETTVALRGPGGVGGRNQELALSAALALEGWEGVALGSMGTDGVDGVSDAAGALVDGTTTSRAREAGLDPLSALDRHDSGSFFAALGDGIVTGPTGTNVNDVVALLVTERCTS